MTDFAQDLPPELQAELGSILTRRKLAEERASKYAGGYIGAQGNRALAETDQQMKDLTARYNTGLQGAVQNYMQTKLGVPAIQEPPDEAGGGPGRPGVAPDPRRAVIEALMSQYGPLARVGASELSHQQKLEDPVTLHEGDLRVMPGPGGGAEGQRTFANPKVAEHAIPANWSSHLPPGASRLDTDPAGVYRMKGTDGQMDVYQLEFDRGALKGSKKLDSSQVVRDSNQNFQTVTVVDPMDTSENPRQMIVRVGQYDEAKYRKGDKTGVVGYSGKETDRGKRDGKRQFNMQGLGKTLQDAEDLLNGVVRDEETGEVIPGKRATLPTGSGVGSVVDAAGALIGKSPAGAVEAQKMKALGGALTSKMPRMEGPQSDKDTLLYKEMAAQVGDDRIPVDRRIAALQTVRQLWQKYERLNSDAFADRRAATGDTAPPGAVRRK